jgi:hypothetical protein
MKDEEAKKSEARSGAALKSRAASTHENRKSAPRVRAAESLKNQEGRKEGRKEGRSKNRARNARARHGIAI